MSINAYVYKNLCRELEIEEWPEVKEKLEADNVSQVLEAAINFKDAVILSKKADQDYEDFMLQFQKVSNTSEQYKKMSIEHDQLVRNVDVMANRQNRFRSKLLVVLFGGGELDYGDLSDYEFD
jgi:hypothetical protein